MDIEALRNHCIRKAGVTEEFPFDEVTLVFKVMGKMFVLTPLDAALPQFAFKCEPDLAIELRENYAAVSPAFHMNKTHWNSALMDGSVPDQLLKSWIDHSYDQVVKGLPKKVQAELLGTAVPSAPKIRKPTA
mgnify:CR=1 FL=1